MELRRSAYRPGRVVEICEVDHLRALRHGGRDGPEIEGHIAQRSQDQARSYLLDRQTVNVEGGFGGDSPVAGGHKGLADQLDQVRRPRAENDLVYVQTVTLSEPAA